MSEETEKDVANGAAQMLNDLCWHDSVLYEIRFIRTDSADEVVLLVDLLDDWEAQVSRRAKITFQGCRLVRSKMDWGVKCMSDGEMIYGANCEKNGSLIDEHVNGWRSVMQVEASDFAEFRLDLASTGSSLEVVFSKAKITYLGVSGSHDAPPPLAPTAT
ncbi:MAG: hypothetical protein ND866_11355 [Pyrinomonadaceae bacterium]|nr:hypothetical protein [Pyrinomonadaceae bacterium]